MGVSFGYVLQTPSSQGASDAASRPYAARTHHPFLGFGLVTPFRRDGKSDFASAGGAALVRSCVMQVLGTECSDNVHTGELPWRPEFGSLLYRLRHASINAPRAELARVYVADAIQRWEPRARVRDVRVLAQASQPNGHDDTLVIRVKCDLVTSNAHGNQVVPGVEFEVEI